MELKELITIDPETLGGQPVFKGTRVPVETLFDHLETGISLSEFLEDFPTVSKEQVIALFQIANEQPVAVSNFPTPASRLSIINFLDKINRHREKLEIERQKISIHELKKAASRFGAKAQSAFETRVE